MATGWTFVISQGTLTPSTTPPMNNMAPIYYPNPTIRTSASITAGGYSPPGQPTSFTYTFTVTGTFTPGPGESGPTPVIEYEDASCGANKGAAAGDGCGDPDVSGTDSATSSGTHVTEPGSTTFTHTVTMTASFSGPSGGGPGFYYSVSGSSEEVSISGTTPDPNTAGQGDILIGQPATAGFSGTSFASYGYTESEAWTVTGTTFTSWRPTLTASGPNPTTTSFSFPGTATSTWYWAEGSTTFDNITCVFTLTPTGSQPPISPITETQSVEVFAPIIVGSTGTGGTISVIKPSSNPTYGILPNQNDYYLLAGGAIPGMTWTLTSSLPTWAPQFGSGNLRIIQLRNPDRTQTPVGGNLNEYDPGEGLDHSPIYVAGGNDNPCQDITGSQAAGIEDVFNDYLMYTPPGNGSATVPVGTFTWVVDDDVSAAGGNWSNYTGSPVDVSPSGISHFSASNSWPVWTQDDTGP